MRFFTLKFGDKFDLADGETYQKETWRSAVRSYGPRYRVKLWPMSKVLPVASPLVKMMRRNAVQFAKLVVAALAKPSPFIGLLEGGKFPARTNESWRRITRARSPTTQKHSGTLPTWEPSLNSKSDSRNI